MGDDTRMITAFFGAGLNKMRTVGERILTISTNVEVEGSSTGESESSGKSASSQDGESGSEEGEGASQGGEDPNGHVVVELPDSSDEEQDEGSPLLQDGGRDGEESESE